MFRSVFDCFSHFVRMKCRKNCFLDLETGSTIGFWTTFFSFYFQPSSSFVFCTTGSSRHKREEHVSEVSSQERITHESGHNAAVPSAALSVGNTPDVPKLQRLHYKKWLRSFRERGARTRLAVLLIGPCPKSDALWRLSSIYSFHYPYIRIL